MNWLNKLLRPSTPPPPAPRSAAPGAPSSRSTAPVPRPPADLERLRAALATASGEGRVAAADELGRALAQAQQAPRADDPACVRTAYLCHIGDKAAALAEVARLDTQDDLATLALKARFAEIRLAAAERLQDDAVLRRVAQGSRERDKNVYRHCSDELKRRRRRIERAQRAGELAQALDALLASAPLSVSRLIELERELQAVGQGTELPTPEEVGCASQVATANLRIREETAAQRGLQADHDAAAALLGHCEAGPLDAAEQLAGWRDAARRLADAQATRPAWLATQAPGAALAAMLARIESRLAVLAAEEAQRQARVQALEEEQAQAQARAQAEAEVQAKAVEEAAAHAETARADDEAATAACTDFLDGLGSDPIDPAAVAAWQALRKPAGGPAAQALEQRWQVLHPASAAAPAEAAAEAPAGAPAEAEAAPEAAPSPAQRPASSRRAPAAAPRRVDRDAVRDQLEQLEHQLDEGHLHDAETAARRIKSAVDAGGAGAELDARLLRAQARLAQLRDWAKWGAERKREDLLAAAHELLVEGVDVDRLVATVPALRQEWQRLASQGVATKAEAENFNALLDRAYQPVIAYRAQRAAQHAQARAAKEALFAEWDGAITAPPAAAEARVDEPRVDEPKVDEPRAPDLSALEALRQRMLSQWRTAPHAGYKDERALRKRFDSLLGALDRRIHAIRAAEVERRESLIAAIDALREAPDLRQALVEAKSLQERWRVAARSPGLRRGEEQALWQRFRAGCDAVFGRRDAERAAQVARQGERVAARRALLDGFAATLDSAEPARIERARAQFRSDWGRADGESDGELERAARDLQLRATQRLEALRRGALRSRLDELARGAAPIEGLDEDELAEGRDARAVLLIDLELALEMPTPEADAPARRRRQLELLKDRFAGGTAKPAAPEAMLARWYAIPAAPDPAAEARIAAVVQRLVERAQ
jgi:hypothetical protein